MSGTQFLCFGEYILYKGNNTYNINSCETIEMFYNIRIDLDKLKYAVYITKIVTDVTTENQNSYKILQLYLNTLYVISSTEKDLNLVISIFRIRLMSIIGFRPSIDKCVACASKEEFEFFSFLDYGLKCTSCGYVVEGAVKISETTKDAIKYIVLSDAKKIYSFEVNEESKRELEIVSKLYLTEKLEKEYKL